MNEHPKLRAIVALTTTEWQHAAVVGVTRRIKARSSSREEVYGSPVAPWDADIEGACAECAVAKSLEVDWQAETEPDHAGDVGEIGVRHSKRADASLILHPGDPNEKVFVLVTGTDGNYRLRGWILACDGKQKQYWRDPSGKGRFAFFVPQSALNDVSHL